MNRHTRQTTVIAVIVALLAALAAGGGVWLAQRDGETPPAATGVTTAPTPSAGPTTPQAQTMRVRVYFHEQAPGPESDPGKVVPVSRTVPRSPKVATAALNELLRGPTAGERAAGYWPFFSDDTAGMLRGVRVTGGTGFADFRDFRRLLPNATSSYGSTALLAELDATLRQFPTIKRTLYAFNGEVPAFCAWQDYKTTVTPRSKDRGKDIIAERPGPQGEVVFIQCKNWRGRVDVDPVSALLGRVERERATRGVIVATSGFTRGPASATEFAEQDNRLGLISGRELVPMLNEHLGRDWPQRLDRLIDAERQAKRTTS